MPIAEPFSTNGAYNGFPSCFDKVDVSGFDFWITASGYNKDDSAQAPTQSQIDQSLQAAGKLFWNLHKVTLDTFYDEWSFSELSIEEPNKRICGDGSRGEVKTDLNTFVKVIVDLSQTSGIQRFYNG